MRLKTPTADPPISPAAAFLLVTGRFAPSGVRGWATLHWQMEPYAHDAEVWRDGVVTAEIAAWLEAQGGAYGFRPWGLRGRGPRPRGATVDAWTRDFVMQHGRRDDPPMRREPEPRR